MTTRAASVLGALSPCGNQWDTINWRPIERQVRRLQMRIAKAVREGRWGKVNALQWLLTHSFSAKLLAVKRVVHNPGRRTPGVDQVVWRTAGFCRKFASVSDVGEVDPVHRGITR